MSVKFPRAELTIKIAGRRAYQENEEDAKIQSHSVVSAQIDRLNGGFADKRDQDTRQPNEHEPSAAKSFDEEGTEDIARKCRQDPE